MVRSTPHCVSPLPVTLVHRCSTQTLNTEDLGPDNGNRREILSAFWWLLLANSCRHRSYFMDEETEARLPAPLRGSALSRKSAFQSFKTSSFLMGKRKREKEQTM